MASTFRLSYHKRLFLLLLLFSWSMILCFAVFLFFREKQSKSEVLNAQLQIYNRHVLHTAESWDVDSALVLPPNQPFDELRVTVINLDGDVLYDNRLQSGRLDNHGNRPEVLQALKYGSGYNIERKSASDGQLYFYSATKGEWLIVRAAIPYSVTLQELLQADWAFLWGVFVFSVVMSVLAYFVTRRLGLSIERLNRFAAKMEKGESCADEEPFPNDELGSISNHIMQLYARWQQTIVDRDREHAAAMREEQEKIRIKRQLTNNINHELKTPVASMQVCLETLLSDIELSEEQQHELIVRCAANNDRLRRLLADVSLITRMEDGSQLIEKEAVCLNEILDDMVDEMTPMLEDKQIAVEVEIGDRVVVDGNGSLLFSIFHNLMENAVNYSGGKHVYIRLLEHSGQHYHIRFEDDGCGVDDSQLPRLFERFYRVDKGRSRQKGGTGLGLSIVKHAVLFHGGTIMVSNRPQGGLRFDIILPAEGIVDSLEMKDKR